MSTQEFVSREGEKKHDLALPVLFLSFFCGKKYVFTWMENGKGNESEEDGRKRTKTNRDSK